MNVRLDCTWLMIGDKDEAAVMKMLGHLVKNFSEWCCSKGIHCAWIHVNEVGQTFGLHAHMMLAVPNEMRPACRKWVKAFLIDVYLPGDKNSITWLPACATLLAKDPRIFTCVPQFGVNPADHYKRPLQSKDREQHHDSNQGSPGRLMGTHGEII